MYIGLSHLLLLCSEVIREVSLLRSVNHTLSHICLNESQYCQDASRLVVTAISELLASTCAAGAIGKNCECVLTCMLRACVDVVCVVPQAGAVTLPSSLLLIA